MGAVQKDAIEAVRYKEQSCLFTYYIGVFANNILPETKKHTYRCHCFTVATFTPATTLLWRLKRQSEERGGLPQGQHS